jgi:type IV secretory pathway VirB4 component
MPINLDKVATKIMKMFTRGDVARDKAWYKDNIAWWMGRYETLITTEAEDVVRNAVTMLNDAVALRDNAVNLLAQLDNDAMEVEREITRLGGIAFIEQLQPTIKERKVYLDNLYESLTRGRPAERWENP